MSTGFKLPKKGIMIGIQQNFQAEFLPTAMKFHQMGYDVSSSTTNISFYNNTITWIYHMSQKKLQSDFPHE